MASRVRVVLLSCCSRVSEGHLLEEEKVEASRETPNDCPPLNMSGSGVLVHTHAHTRAEVVQQNGEGICTAYEENTGVVAA